MAAHRGSLLLIPCLALLFFADLVLHPTATLYTDYSDLLTLLLPYKRFLVHAWHETGQLPLWCPYNFAGLPFAHDLSASAFYPPHWPLLLLPEESLGAAMSWLVVVHVIVAGWCMYAYAWHHGLRGPGALAAAVGYMFAGKVLLHVLAAGHYNMVTLAWLPLVLLWLEQAVRSGSVVRATWAGVAFALIILGSFPYVTLYVGLFVALWTLGTALEQAGYLDGTGERSSRRTRTALVRWTGLGAWAALVAVSLSAVQLLPGLEAAAQASRSAGVELSRDYFLNGFRSLVGLVGPAVSTEPNSWENRAGLGVIWLTLAVLAPALGSARTRYQSGVLAALVVFSLGGAAAFQWLPGFRLFRLPSRMLLVAALPVCLLAATSVQTLLFHPTLKLATRRWCRRTLLKIAAVVVLMAGTFAFTLHAQRPDLQVRVHPYWATLLLTIPCAYWLMARRGLGPQTPQLEGEGDDYKGPESRTVRPALLGLAWVGVLAVDAAALTWPLVAVRPDADIYAPSACVRYLADRRGEHGRVLDFNPEDFAANHTPLWPGLAAVERIEPVKGFNPVDVLRYKEYLQFILDRDEPLQALDGMFTGPLVGTFPIRNQALADLLGIRFLLQPSALSLELTVQDDAGRSAWAKAFEDPNPRTYNFISVQPSGSDCGVQPLPPYTVYENHRALPRAFVVPEVAPLPDRKDVLAALKATDFRRRVYLEGYPAGAATPERPEAASFRPAQITEYRPNQVALDLEPGPAGFLVLTDIWFPGWVCTVNDQAVPVYRANFVFRGVELPAGARRAVFTFAPASYAWGRAVSGWAVVAVLALTLVGLGFKRAPATAPAYRERKPDVVPS